MQPTFIKGVLINALNPKIAVFFISYLPQFVDEASGAPIAQIFFLGLLFSLRGTAVCVFYILLASKASDRLQFFSNIHCSKGGCQDLYL